MYTLYYLLFNTVFIKNSPTCFETMLVHLQGLNRLLHHLQTYGADPSDRAV
jgi:hypothetical protein